MEIYVIYNGYMKSVYQSKKSFYKALKSCKKEMNDNVFEGATYEKYEVKHSGTLDEAFIEMCADVRDSTLADLLTE